MSLIKKTKQELQAENDELRARLEEAEETLNAIRSGEVDALIVDGKDGQQVYTLAAADRSYRILLESMEEGAVTLNSGGVIMYCNSFFAKLLKTPHDELIGKLLLPFIPQSERRQFMSLLAQCGSGEFNLKASDNYLVPVYLSVNMLPGESEQRLSCLIVTDLRNQKRDDKIIAEGKLSQRVFEQTAETLIICDEKGKIIRASNAAHHLAGQDPLYQPFDAMFALTHSSGKRFTFARALRKPILQIADVSFLRKDGKTFYLVCTSSPLADDHGKILGYIITLGDITKRKQAEDALRASEQRFRTLAEEMPHFVWEADVEGIPLYANKRFYEYTGVNLEQAQAGGWLAVQHPEDAPKVAAAWREALAACCDYDLESRFREAATGQYRWFRIKGSPVRDAAGQIFRWVGTCTDIHEQKQTEEALRESEERLRLLGDNLPDRAVYQYVYEADGSIRFLYLSAGIERLNGISVQEVLRDTGTLPRQVPPEYLSQIVEAETLSAHNLTDFNMELPIRRPDGQVRWMHFHSRPRRLPDGSVVWDGVQTDITGRKRAEEAHRKSEERLSFALETMHVGAWELNLEDNTAHRTPDHDRIFGYDTLLPQWTYEMFLEHVLPEDRPAVDRQFQDALQTQTDWNFECRIRRADGEIRWIWAAGRHRTDKSGQPRRMAGIVQDITDA